MGTTHHGWLKGEPGGLASRWAECKVHQGGLVGRRWWWCLQTHMDAGPHWAQMPIIDAIDPDADLHSARSHHWCCHCCTGLGPNVAAVVEVCKNAKSPASASPPLILTAATTVPSLFCLQPSVIAAAVADVKMGNPQPLLPLHCLPWCTLLTCSLGYPALPLAMCIDLSLHWVGHVELSCGSLVAVN